MPPIQSDVPDALSLATRAAALATAAMATGIPPEAGALARARTGLEHALSECPTDIDILFLAFQFHFRLGELDAAEQYARRRLEVAGPDDDSLPTARALCNLGLIAHRRGNFDQAEDLLSRALEMSRRLGDRLGIARDLGNLALVPESRGDLDRAEALFREGLEVARSIPGPAAEEIAAGKIANLGDIAAARGRREEARACWVEAAAIFKRLGVTKWDADMERKLSGRSGSAWGS